MVTLGILLRTPMSKIIRRYGTRNDFQHSGQACKLRTGSGAQRRCSSVLLGLETILSDLPHLCWRSLEPGEQMDHPRPIDRSAKDSE
jgi:hypothetical protein